MGSSQSSSSLASTMTDISENVFKMVSDTRNSSSAICDNNQTIKIDYTGSTWTNCPMNIKNVAVVDCKLTASFSGNNSNDLKTLINQAIDQSSNSSNSTVQNFLSMSMSNTSDNKAMSTYMKNLVDREFTLNSTNSCVSKLINNQNIVLDMKNSVHDCGGQPQDISNDAQLKAFTDCISSQLNNLISSDTLIQQSAQQSDQTNSTIQKGIGDALATVFGSIAGPIMYVLLGVLVLFCCAVSAALIFLLSPAGQDASRMAVKGVVDIAQQDLAPQKGVEDMLSNKNSSSSPPSNSSSSSSTPSIQSLLPLLHSIPI